MFPVRVSGRAPSVPGNLGSGSFPRDYVRADVSALVQDGGMTDLPNGVDGIIEFLAGMAKGYDNHLKWNEIAMFKADLMNATDRWLVIDPNVFKAACLREGMREVDAAELTDYLRRRQQGKRLVPQKSYRDHKFPAPIEVRPVRPKVVASRIW